MLQFMKNLRLYYVSINRYCYQNWFIDNSTTKNLTTRAFLSNEESASS